MTLYGYMIFYIHIYVMPLGFEKGRNSDTEHSMPLARRWGGFNSD